MPTPKKRHSPLPANEKFHTVGVRLVESELETLDQLAERFGAGHVAMSRGGVLRVLIAEAKALLAEKGAVITRDSRLRVAGGGRFLREAPSPASRKSLVRGSE